jgi:peptidyl-prolyl cis-trans isomerase C
MTMDTVKTFSNLTIALLCWSLAACSHAPVDRVATPANPVFSAPESGRAVARVNGREISADELKRAEKILIANKPGFRVPPLLEKEFEMQALNQLISTELLFQASQKFEIKELDRQAALQLARIKDGFADSQAYAKGLQDIGLDEQTFLESIRRDLAIAYFVNTKFAPGVTVSEAELTTFYEKNPQSFLQEERVRASHILIAVAGRAGAKEKKGARDKADELRAELAKGADFAVLAKENSDCPSSRQGGDLGFITKGKTAPQFEQAAFALEPGSVSAVVETEFGYHIIKVIERKKAEVLPLSAARDKIKSYLRAQKINEANQAFVGEARRAAQVEVLL